VGLVAGAAVDASYVYWLASDGVWRIGLDGAIAGLTKIAPMKAIGITVSNGDVYIGTDSNDINYPDRVMKIPANGNNPITIATNQSGVYSLAVNAGTLYWSAGFGRVIMKNPTTGSTLNPTTVTSNVIRALYFAVDANNVYFSDLQSAASTFGSIRQVSVNNNDAVAPQTLTSNIDTPANVAVDGTSVYWVEGNAVGAVNKVPIGGGTVTPLLMHLTYGLGLALDGTNLYTSSRGLLYRVSTSGGTPATFSYGLSPANWMAAGTAWLYVLTPDGQGALYRFPKF
jgi:hypothetical protein